MMEKQSKTFNGQLSTLTGNLKNVGIAIGNELLPMLNKYISTINEVMLKANQLKEFEKGGSKVEESFLNSTSGQIITNLATAPLYLPSMALTGKSQAEHLNEFLGGGEQISVGQSQKFKDLEQKRRLKGLKSGFSVEDVSTGVLKRGGTIKESETIIEKKVSSIEGSFNTLIAQLQEERSNLR